MPGPEQPSEGASSGVHSSRSRARYNLRNRDSPTSPSVNDSVVHHPPPSTPRSRRKSVRAKGSALPAGSASAPSADTRSTATTRRHNVESKTVASSLTTPGSARRLRSASVQSPLAADSNPEHLPPRPKSARRKPRPVSAVGASSASASATRSARTPRQGRHQVPQSAERTDQVYRPGTIAPASAARSGSTSRGGRRQATENTVPGDHVQRPGSSRPSSANRSACISREGRRRAAEQSESRDQVQRPESSGPASATRSVRTSHEGHRQDPENAERSRHTQHPAKLRTRGTKQQIAELSNENGEDVEPDRALGFESDSESRMTDAEKSIENIDAWRKADLVIECKRRNLHITGNKKDLRERIIEDLRPVREVSTVEGDQPDRDDEKPVPVAGDSAGVRTRRRPQRAQRHLAATAMPANNEDAKRPVLHLGSIGNSAIEVKPAKIEDVGRDNQPRETAMEVLTGTGELQTESKPDVADSGKGTVMLKRRNHVSSQGVQQAFVGEVGESEEKNRGIDIALREKAGQDRCAAGEAQMNDSSGDVDMGLDESETADRVRGRTQDSFERGPITRARGQGKERRLSEGSFASCGGNLSPHGTADVAVDGSTGLSARTEDLTAQAISAIEYTPAQEREEPSREIADRTEAGRDPSTRKEHPDRDDQDEDRNLGNEGPVHDISLPSTSHVEDLQFGIQGVGGDTGKAGEGPVLHDTVRQAAKQVSGTARGTRSIDNRDRVTEESDRNIWPEDSTDKIEKSGTSRPRELGRENELAARGLEDEIRALPSSAACEDDREVHFKSNHGSSRTPSSGREEIVMELRGKLPSQDTASPHGNENDPTQRNSPGSEKGPEQDRDGVASAAYQKAEGRRDESNHVADVQDSTLASTHILVEKDPGPGQGSDLGVQGSRLSDCDNQSCDPSSKPPQEHVNKDEKADQHVTGNSGVDEIANKGNNEVSAVALGEGPAESSQAGQDSFVERDLIGHLLHSQGRNKEQMRSETEPEMKFDGVGGRCDGPLPADAAEGEVAQPEHRFPVPMGAAGYAPQVKSSTHGGSAEFPKTDSIVASVDVSTFSESPLPSPRPCNSHENDTVMVSGGISAAGHDVVLREGGELSSQPLDGAVGQDRIDQGRDEADLVEESAADPQDTARVLEISQANTSGMTEAQAALDNANANANDRLRVGSSNEEGTHPDAIQAAQFETLNSYPVQDLGDEGQGLYEHASAGEGSSLFPDVAMAVGGAVPEPHADEVQNVHVPAVSSADELSSEDSEEDSDLNGDESGGVGDPVDEAVEGDGSSSAGDEDAHSGDSRSSQGSLPEVACSDQLSPGGSWSSGQPSGASPRSGASSSLDDDEEGGSDERAGFGADDRGSPLPPVDEIANLSDDGLLSASGRPSSDRAGVAAATPDAGEALDGAIGNGGYSAERRDLAAIVSAEPKATTSEHQKVSHDFVINNMETRIGPETFPEISRPAERDGKRISERNARDIIDGSQACSGQAKLQSIERSGATPNAGGLAGRILAVDPEANEIQKESAGVLQRGPAALSSHHGDFSESLVKDTSAMTNGYQRGHEALRHSNTNPARSSSHTSVPNRDPRAPPPSPLHGSQTFGADVMRPEGSALPPTGIVNMCREQTDVITRANDSLDVWRIGAQHADGLCSTERAGTAPVTTNPKRSMGDMGTVPLMDRPVKRQRVSSLLVPVKQMPSPALTLSNLEPVFPFRTASRQQSNAVSRALEFGSTRSSAPTSLVERILRLQGNRRSSKFTAFRDTIRDRMEQKKRPSATSTRSNNLFHIGSVSTKKRNISKIGPQKRAKLQILRARRAWDAEHLAAESLRRTMDMAEQMSAWKNAPSPFNHVSEPQVGTVRSREGMADTDELHADNIRMAKRRRS